MVVTVSRPSLARLFGHGPCRLSAWLVFKFLKYPLIHFDHATVALQVELSAVNLQLLVC